jgi:hypothetical protein
MTAAEIVYSRADSTKSNMGLTTWRGTKVRKQDVSDVSIAKNYLNEEELLALNGLVEQYLLFAERQAHRRQPMYMADWIKRLDAFLSLNEENILTHVGKISHDLAQSHAEKEYQIFHARRQLEARNYDHELLGADSIASTRKKLRIKKD